MPNVANFYKCIFFADCSLLCSRLLLLVNEHGTFCKYKYRYKYKCKCNNMYYVKLLLLLLLCSNEPTTFWKCRLRVLEGSHKTEIGTYFYP